jgi:hypothetical protein
MIITEQNSNGRLGFKRETLAAFHVGLEFYLLNKRSPSTAEALQALLKMGDRLESNSPVELENAIGKQILEMLQQNDPSRT